MKRTLLIAASLSALFVTSAFAGKDEHEHKALMLSKLAQDSSPANVKAVALQRKAAYCEKNVKNKGLQGSEKESYFNTCMKRDEAYEQLAMVKRGNVNMASTDINKTLQQSPAAAGAK